MRIVTIGAGSIVWGPTINTDFLLNEALDGAELVLMDVDVDSLDLVRRYLERLIAERGFRKTIRATTDLDDAVRGADYVAVAIAVGGDRLWRYDAIFPQIYGIFQPVGDTTGPGGMMRALRHAPALLRIARAMARLSRPGAPLLQLTNPMNPLCAALDRLGAVPVYGICHGVNDTEQIFARQLGIPAEQVRVVAAGNNHHIYCTEIALGADIYDQASFDMLAPRLLDTPFRAEVYRRYGALAGNYSRHPIEFLPGFLTPEAEFGHAWGVRPVPREIDPLLGDRHDASRQILERAIAQREPVAWRAPRGGAGLALTPEGAAETGHSRERIDDFIAALEHRTDFFIHLNLRNDGALAGVDPAHNVEIPVDVRGGQLVRRAARLRSDALTAEVERVGREQSLLAAACLDGDRALLVESLSLDALVPSRAIAVRLVAEMTAFQRDDIPP